MANKKYVNNEKDGWNQECEEDLLNLLDELNTKKIKSDEVCKIISIKKIVLCSIFFRNYTLFII